MSKNYLPYLFTAFWPGLGHIYLKKYQGVIYFFIWMYVLSRLLLVNQTFLLIWLPIMAIFGGLLYDIHQILRKEKQITTLPWALGPFFIIILAYGYLSLPLKWVNPQATIGNLHGHTLCSDGSGDYEQTMAMARKLKFDFIAFTDHRFAKIGLVSPPKVDDDKVCSEIYTKCQQENRLLCLLGQEVTGRAHILAIGIKEQIDFPNLEKGKDIKAVVEEIHRQGGLAIAAHPMPQGAGGRAVMNDEELINSGFDAMECERSTWGENSRQDEISEKYNLPCVYNSDAHSTGMLATVYNTCAEGIKTFEDLKMAIKNNKCRRFSPLYHRVATFVDYI